MRTQPAPWRFASIATTPTPAWRARSTPTSCPKASTDFPNRRTQRCRLRLRRKRIKFGSKRVRVAAKKRKGIRFKLKGRVRGLLYRKRRLKVKAILKIRGPIGKSKTVRKTLILKAPKRPWRRPRRPGGVNTPGTGNPFNNPCGTPVFEPGHLNFDGTYTPGQLKYCPGLY